MNNSYQWVLNNYKILTREQETILFQQLQSNNKLIAKKSRDTIFYSNLRLVFKIATNFKQRGYPNDLDDLVSEGIFGLNRAINKFDYTKGFKFSTYACNWIKSFIDRRANDQKDTIRKPVHIITDSLRIKKCIREYERINNKYPSLVWVAEQFNLTVEKVNDILALKPLISLNKPAYNDDGNISELIDIISDTQDSSPDDYLNSQLQIEGINNLLEILEPADRKLLKMKYGLNDENKVYTLKQIGESLNLSLEQIRSRALRSIRELRKSKGIAQLKQFI